MPLIKLGDYANGTFIDRDEWVAELSNIYNTFNGNNSANEFHHRFSGANPSLIVDQISTGLICDFRFSGLSKSPILNNGKITNDNVIKKKFAWSFNFAADPFSGANPRLTSRVNEYFIIPTVVGARVTKLSLLFNDAQDLTGAPTTVPSGFNCTLQLLAPDAVGSGVRIGGSNLTNNTEYSESLNVSVSSNTIIALSNITLTNSGLTALRIIALMEWEQRLG